MFPGRPEGAFARDQQGTPEPHARLIGTQGGGRGPGRLAALGRQKATGKQGEIGPDMSILVKIRVIRLEFRRS
jgi:hypothetical protein